MMMNWLAIILSVLGITAAILIGLINHSGGHDEK